MPKKLVFLLMTLALAAGFIGGTFGCHLSRSATSWLVTGKTQMDLSG